MARRASNRSSKAVIRVFCEGESEQAYIDFLKMQFQDVAAIKYPRGTGLFETAKDSERKIVLAGLFLKQPRISFQKILSGRITRMKLMRYGFSLM